VRVYARIALLLGAYLLAGGLIYGGTSKERIGLVLLLVAGSGFTYVGLYTRRAVRASDRAARDAAGGEPGTQVGTEPGSPGAQAPPVGPQIEEVRPTIWPLVFSLAGAGLVAGILTSHWVLLVGGLLAVAAAAGWFREVLTQRHGHG
jgi:Cytochrome c oxidase subunit IV